MVTNRIARKAFAALEILMGLAAVGGGLDLVLTNRQLMGMPAELLRGSPFGSYFIPGLVLLVVGTINLAAAIAVLRRHPLSAQASVVAGIMWMGWFVVQVAVVGLMNWQQPVYIVVGLLIIVLAVPSLSGQRRVSSF